MVKDDVSTSVSFFSHRSWSQKFVGQEARWETVRCEDLLWSHVHLSGLGLVLVLF